MKPHETNTNNPVDFPKIENTKNERILELAEQAGSTHKQNLGVYQFYEDELEKFALTIIQECATIADEACGYRFPASSYGDLIRKFERLKESDYTIQLGVK